MTAIAEGALIRRFDALLFDLDGVIYVGPHAVPHAADVVARAREAGIACTFVTNNAARTPDAVAAHLTQVGMPATAADVVTSPQAAVTLLGEFVPEGSRVLVIGGDGITAALTARGYVPVYGLADEPAAVMQGYSPDLSWRELAEATFAVRTGIPWIATNPDLTFPTPRGVAPGNGALVKVVAESTGREPNAVAGKPEPPLIREAIHRTAASRPLMVGDRLDTDIEAGARAGIPSLLVFTGVTTLHEVLSAVPPQRPEFLGYDLRVLLDPYPTVELGDGTARCGQWCAEVDGVDVALHGPGLADWDALRAAAALSWHLQDDGGPPRVDAVVKQLSHLVSARDM